MKRVFFIIYIIVLLLTIRLSGAGIVSRSESDVKKALKQISPSVVKVVTQNHRRYIASGVAIDRNLVLSNIMVLQHPFDRIYIETMEGKTHDVKVVGKDKNSSLILLRTEEKTLKPAKQGAAPGTGEWVGLVGVFYKQFPFLNQGIVSGGSNNELILNATVAPGSTGGAVVNKKGELIGIIRGVFGYEFFPQYIFKDNQSELKIVSPVRGGNDLCYVIPTGRMLRIARDLEDFGRVKRGWLGVSISKDEKGAIRVDNVVKTSPAESGGIIKGDIIIDVSGKTIKTPAHLSESIQMLRPGDRITVSIDRKGKKIKAKVKLADLELSKTESMVQKELQLATRMSIPPELIDSLPKVPNYTFEFSDSLTLGVDVIPLTPELAKEFRVSTGSGLLVSKVNRKDDPGEAPLKVGDILISSNGVPLKKVSDLSVSLKKVTQKDLVKIKLIRKGKTIERMVSPSAMATNLKLIEEFNKKFSGARFWMQRQQEMKMKEDLKKLKMLELGEINKNEKTLRKEELKILQEEYEKRRKESLEKYKKEIEQLIKEKKAIEEELKKIKKKEDDPGQPLN